MTWNESREQAGPEIGWHWYRETPTSQLRPVKIFDVARLKYAWPMGTDPEHPLTVRVEQCRGEFMGPLKSQMAEVESRRVDRASDDVIIDECGLDQIATAALKASRRGGARHGG